MLRAEGVEQGVTDPGQVQVASAGQLLELVKHLFRTFEGEQRGLPRAQVLLQALCEVHRYCPVRTRFTGRGDGTANVGDATFRVGHRAFLLAPAGGRQQQVGKGGGFGGAKGFLQDHERTSLQGCAHVVQVRQ
ncbi:hypothetical protein D3C78_1026760 [compost metagenome]